MVLRKIVLAASLALAPMASAQVVTHDNSRGTFVWVPALALPDGTPVLTERNLDITLNASDNQAGLGDPFRFLTYGYFIPPTSETIYMDRVMRLFPNGFAGIASGDHIILETDAGVYSKHFAESDAVGDSEVYTTNACITHHAIDGSQNVLGERLTIGVRVPVANNEQSYFYGYVVLEWREGMVFDNLIGGTTTINMYQPVEWAWESTPDTPITVPEESDCLADTNGDGSVTAADFSAWIAAFNAQAPQCDQNGDALCTAADFSAWIANYNTGC